MNINIIEFQNLGAKSVMIILLLLYMPLLVTGNRLFLRRLISMHDCFGEEHITILAAK